MLPRLTTVALVGLLTIGIAPPAARPLPTAVEGAIQQVTAAELRQHVALLASDELAGLDPGA